MAARRPAKSSLFEYCQKRKIGPPYIETWAAPNGYQAKVVIDGYAYPCSAVFPKKKEAEHDASAACLASLGIFEGDVGGVGPELGNQAYPGANQRGRSGFATPSPRRGGLPNSGGSSGGNVKMPKSALHEFCQSQKMSLPQYETEASYDGTALLGFNCVLVVKDEFFTTDRLYTNKRDAEHAVARKALNVFGYYARTPLYTGNIPTNQNVGTPSFKTPETSYKNLLQEHLQQRNIETPSYETQLTDGGYMSKVTIEGKTFKAKECCQTKKMAEQSAAKAGLIGMGVRDPEAVANKLLRKKGQFRSPDDVPYKKNLRDLEPDQLETDQVQGNTSWVHNRKQSEFDVDDYDDIDGDFTDFQKAAPVQLKRKLDESVDDSEDFFGTPIQRPHKMQRVGEQSENNSRPSSEKRPKRRGEYEVEDVHLGNLTVGESWPERRNVVIVGSEETSIPLFCQADTERCALEDASTGQLVDIIPGHRLVGLEGYYVVRGGQIVLRASHCRQVVMPEEPDKVLISCGVVVLHCIPRRNGTETSSCDVNVLLKRYLCSQAFINVVRGLAQYFRCKQSNRPFTLNKALMVAHIRDWMLEEVMAIASFSEAAMENVFQHTMKFDKRWVKYLADEELSEELRAVQVAANEELFRRANSAEDQNQDRFRPWRLPKGNFHHRILTTGVFIESPAEAAMRELKEETGIKLKLSDICSSPFVDLSQTDNLNPHKGDFARYYLCGIITEAEAEEVENVEELQPEQEPVVENSESAAVASASAAAAIVTTCVGTTPNYANTTSNYANTLSTPAITNSTYTEACAANVAGNSAVAGTTYGGAYSAHGGAGYGTQSGYTDTGCNNTDTNSSYGSTNADTSAQYCSTATYSGGTYSAQQSTNSAGTGPTSAYSAGTGPTSAYSAYSGTGTYPGTNSYGSASTADQGTDSTRAGAYSANTSSNSGNTSSAYPSAYSAYTDPYSAYAATDPAYPGTGSAACTATQSTPANTRSTYTGIAGTSATAANTGPYTAQHSAYDRTDSSTATGSSNAGAYSANTGMGGASSGSSTAASYSGSSTAASYSGSSTAASYSGPYSAYADAYSAYTNTVSGNIGANSDQDTTSTNSTHATTNSSQAGTSLNTNTTNAAASYHGSYSADKDPAIESTNSTTTDTQMTSTDQNSSQPDATKGDENRSANIEEESQVIRSPFVAGAVHEECKWFDMEEAKEISTIFLEIHNTPEFQKLMAKLKGIVSAM